MTQKKKPGTPYLKLADTTDLEQIRKTAKHHRKEIYKKSLITIILAAMIVGGTYLLLKNQAYTKVHKTASYTKETSDSNWYAQFAEGFVRYSRDGIVYLNRKNEEMWIQSCQMNNPVIDVNGEVFAVADNGGNSILVFTEKGLKGEIETNLPIEKMSVSGQGIVSVILANEESPMVISYDATGNILVEHQVTQSSTGYPVALDMSADGTMLGVSYLTAKDGVLKSKVIYYNFSEKGQEKSDNQVSMEEYSGSIVPEIFFMNESVSVAAGDDFFAIYQGKEIPQKKKVVKLNQEIKSVFHSDRYIGFVLLNKAKSGYEVRLYNQSGKQILNKEFTGEYSNVKMAGNEVIMYSGSKCCIINKYGVLRFKGDLKIDALEIIPVGNLNKYLVMSANELRAIYLAG